ncbi:hypothetical protein SDC9_206515 [bioreactor metagenome]|uniref:Uncharacterized protein n=1 Tax=bioreactor metagenome TaxID=1076179 RepID=A0A645J6N5_9ZZZZ
MDCLNIQLIDHAFQDASVEIRSRTAVNDPIAFAPARTIQQDHPVSGLYQRINIAAEVCPARRARTGAVQQHDGLFALSTVIEMHA